MSARWTAPTDQGDGLVTLVHEQHAGDPGTQPVLIEGVSVADLVFTWFLTKTTATAYTRTNIVCHALAAWGAASAGDRTGTARPAFPGLDQRSWTSGEKAVERLGTTPVALRERFMHLRHRDGARAAFERAELEQFFPEPLHEVLVAMVWAGPAAAAARAEIALWLTAKRQVPATRRRPAGPISRGALQTRRDALRRLMALVVAARGLAPEHPALRDWQAVPQIQLPPPIAAPPPSSANAAPSPRELRVTLQGLDACIGDKLRLRPGESEREAVELGSPERLRRAGAERPMKLRLTLELFLVTGARISELADLRTADYLPDHRGPRPDLRRGPALIMRPRKQRTLVSTIKHLPDFVGEHLETYTVLVNRRHHAVTGRPAPADRPLLVSDCKRLSAWGEGGIRRNISGVGPRSDGRPGLRPLLVAPHTARPDLPPEHREFLGYSPHAFRHAASQLAERAAELVSARRGAEDTVPASVYAAALLFHGGGEDPLRAIYGDRSSPDFREAFGGRVALAIGELLRDRAGARLVPDAQTYSEILKLAVAAERQLALKRRQLDQRVAEGDLTDVRVGSTPAVLLDCKRRELEIERLARDLQALTARLEQLKHDQDTWLVVPDDQETLPEVDLALIEESVRSTDLSRAHHEAPARVRDWLTTTEFAEVIGANPATIARWALGRSLPRQQHLRPWGDIAPVDASLGPKFRRISIPHVGERFLAAPSVRGRIREALAGWPLARAWSPQGKPGARCTAPLELPAGLPVPSTWLDEHEQ